MTTTSRASRPGRFGVLLLLGGVMLGYATLTRLVLMGWAFHAAELGMVASLQVLAVGLLYDLLWCAYAALPFGLALLLPARWWYSRANRACWHASAFGLVYVLGFIAVAEVVFWDEFQVRFNFIAVDYLVYTHEVLRNIWESYRVVWVLLANLGLTACVYRWLAPRLNAALLAPDTSRIHRWAPLLATGLLVTGFTAAPGDGLRETFTNDYRRELASNGPYQFFSAFRHNEIEYPQFYATLPDDEVDRRLRAAVAEPTAHFLSDAPGDLRRRIDNPGPERRLNVVLIMVESLSADFMGHFSTEHGWTPHLDRLAEQSLSFEDFYATGTRTDRGLEAVTLSVPPTPGRSIVKRLGRESGYWSLGNVLRAKGYDTAFVYGGRGYFDNMNAFFSGNGYRIVDQTSVPSAEISFENAWGMADEDIYRQALKIAAADHARQQPFFMHIMTTSNHRPYTFPDERIALPSGSGRPGAVQYTDWAIDDFIKEASTQPWFKDTVFVILGDHCASSAGKVDLPASRYHVPLLLYAPGVLAPQRITTTASQIDVAPTLLAILGMDYESTAFGRNVLGVPPSQGRALIGNYQYLGLLAGQQVTVLGPRRRVFSHAAAAEVATDRDDAERDEAALAIAYYQGASHAYRAGLMRWQPAPPASRADATAP